MPLDYMYGFTLKLKIKIKVHLIVWFLTNMLSSLPFLHFLFGCVVCLSAQQAHLSQKKKKDQGRSCFGPRVEPGLRPWASGVPSNWPNPLYMHTK